MVKAKKSVGNNPFSGYLFIPAWVIVALVVAESSLFKGIFSSFYPYDEFLMSVFLLAPIAVVSFMLNSKLDYGDYLDTKISKTYRAILTVSMVVITTILSWLAFVLLSQFLYLTF